MDLAERQHAGLAFSLQGSPNIPSFPQECLQTACLLAISNKYGHLFIALSDSILHTSTSKFCDLNSPISFSTFDSFTTSAGSNSCVKCIYLGTSNDGNTLAVCTASKILIFDVPTLIGGTNVHTTIDASKYLANNNDKIKQLCWSSIKPTLFAVLLDNGTVLSCDLQIMGLSGSPRLNTLVEKEASAICWGKNDEIIVGNKSGTIAIYRVVTPSQAEQIATIPVPDSLEEDQSFSVYAVHFIGDWRDTKLNLLLAGYKRITDGRPEQIMCFQLNKQNYHIEHTFAKFPVDADLNRLPTFHVVSIPQWRVLVLFSSTTGMSAIMGLGEDDELYDWFIPEEKRPDLPLQLTTDMDTFPLGVCIDYTRAKEDQNDILALPQLFILSSEGKLFVYSITNTEAKCAIPAVVPLSSPFGQQSPSIFRPTTSSDKLTSTLEFSLSTTQAPITSNQQIVPQSPPHAQAQPQPSAIPSYPTFQGQPTNAPSRSQPPPAAPGQDLRARLTTEVGHFRVEIADIKSRKPLLWHSTCLQLSSLVDSLVQGIPQLEDVKNNSSTLEHFSTLRTKYVATLPTIEEVKARAATFATKGDASSYETRKLDPKSLAIQAKLRVSVHTVETNLESLAEHVDKLALSTKPSNFPKLDTRQLNAVDVYTTINAHHTIAARQANLVDDLTQLFQELSTKPTVKSRSTPRTRPTTPTPPTTYGGSQNYVHPLLSTTHLIPTTPCTTSGTPNILSTPSTPLHGTDKTHSTPNYHVSPLRGWYTPKREQYLY